MAIIVIMPKQGQSVESCIITEIKKKKDSPVKKGDVIFGYETDKATFEEISPIDGVILECFYNEGDEVPVLDNMMIIGETDEDYSSLLNNFQTSKAEEQKSITKDTAAITTKTQDFNPQKTKINTNSELLISPRAQRLAEKEGIDTTLVSGTGPNGRIIEQDILKLMRNKPKMTALAKELILQGSYSAHQGTGLGGRITAKDLKTGEPTQNVDFEIKPLTNIRKLIARAMHTSLQNSAQLTHHLGADARKIISLREKTKKNMEEGTSSNITLNDMIGFAVIKALKQFPQVNTHFLGDSIKYFNKIHLALAVDTDRGLMVPVVRNADNLSLPELSQKFKEVAEACKKGSIDPDLLSSGQATFTISNLGNYGVEMFTPIINLPQTAILGVNTIVHRPVNSGNGNFNFIPYLGLSLTYDHRAIDGGEASKFLKQIAVEIEQME